MKNMQNDGKKLAACDLIAEILHASRITHSTWPQSTADSRRLYTAIYSTYWTLQRVWL